MRITIQHALKVPDAEQYSSRQHSVAMELDVPEDVVAKGKDAIREYIARVTAEVRSCVEEALRDVRIEQQERESIPPEREADAPETTSRRAPPGREPVRPLRRPMPNGDGHAGPSGRAAQRGAPNGEPASMKQIAYLRSLSRDAGEPPGVGWTAD